MNKRQRSDDSISWLNDAMGEQFDVNGRLEAINGGNEKAVVGLCVFIRTGQVLIVDFGDVRREKWAKHRGDRYWRCIEAITSRVLASI